jgi:hypothetical protein
MSDEPDKVYVPAAKVRERYGGISDMSLWRWVRNPEMGFPQPFTINRRRYWRLRDLEIWEQFRATDDEVA